MEKLFVKTDTGILPADMDLIKKYALGKGMYTPFTHFPIVSENGDFTPDKHRNKRVLKTDPAADRMFSVAESLDIAAGADS
ncbi:MAG: hypothetical protein QM689_02330 [Oscillospiraceae bacterium]